MKARALAYIAAQPPRTVLLAMGGIVLLVALQSWLVLLRQPAGEYVQVARERAALQRYAQAPQQLLTEIAHGERDLAAMNERLAGASPQLAAERLVVDVMDRLAAIAARRHTVLHAVRPAGVRRVLMYDELAFDIQAAGAYPALIDWLEDVARELDPLVVTRFSIRRAAAATLNMELRVAAYRLAESGEGVP